MQVKLPNVSVFPITVVDDPNDECLKKLLGQWVVFANGQIRGTFKEKSEAEQMALRFTGGI
jgi:hypothetical protein